ncbi:MAG: hypothetical protein L6R41_005670 [Letrouitia leprolyta]|nr:MAG: hypothetical protein L6R41_005670 [Letrouitia leprolyta]
MPFFPLFQFISDRLAQSKLYVVFIISGDKPFCIPAWPISRAARSKVIRIVRESCHKFTQLPSWLAHLAYRSTDTDATALLKTHPSHAYLTRRSIIQHETIFSGEGLTLLTVDHIYTFKRCLLSLPETAESSPHYKVMLASCTRLLRRINTTYTGVKLSKSYLERAHGIELRRSAFQRVHEAYLDSFGEPGIHDLSSSVEDGTPCLPELESPMNPAPMDFSNTTTKIMPCTHTKTTELSDAWDSEEWPLTSDVAVDRVTYPKVPTLTKPPVLHSPMPSPSGSSEIITTICSRCLRTLETAHVAQTPEMTEFLSPEWENFRRIGLGILTS